MTGTTGTAGRDVEAFELLVVGLASDPGTFTFGLPMFETLVADLSLSLGVSDVRESALRVALSESVSLELQGAAFFESAFARRLSSTPLLVADSRAPSCCSTGSVRF